MDVRLPNGAIIKGVPDGTPKDEIKRKAIMSGLAVEADFPEGLARLRPEQVGEIDAFELPNRLPADDGEGGRNAAPELFKTAAGMMTTMDPQRQMRIISENFPGVVFDRDEEGNFIVDARPIGGTRGYLNKPGADLRDLIQFGGMAAAFTPAGRAAAGGALGAQAIKAGLASGATQAGMDVINQALGGTEEVSAGNIEGGDIAAAAVGGAGGQVLGSYLGQSLARALERRSGDKLISEAAPSIAQLKGASNEIFRRLDESGATIKRAATKTLESRVIPRIMKEGYNPRIHPKVGAVLDEFRSAGNRDMTISEMNTLRRVAQSAANSLEPDEARLGRIMLEQVDDFLDGLPQGAFVGGKGPQAGPMLKEARDLWGRARRGEMIANAIEDASNQASGFENGLRTQFRSLLKNRRKMRGFTNEQKVAMQKVVQGGKPENVLRALGKFGLTADQSSSMLLSFLGIGGGATVGGVPGAIAVPALGTMARQHAQRITRENAGLASALARAGKDARAIAVAYMRNVPKKQQSIEELTGLFLRDGVNAALARQLNSSLAKDASFAATLISSFSSGVGAATGKGVGAVPPVSDEFEDQAENPQDTQSNQRLNNP